MLDSKWSKWANVPDVMAPPVELWEACALSMNIDPEAMNFHPQGWMIGPGDSGPFFTDDTFKNDELKNEYFSRFESLKANLNNRKFFEPSTEVPDLTYLRKISVVELAAFAVHCNWEIPQQLRALKAAPSKLQLPSTETGDGQNITPADFDEVDEYRAAFSELVLNDKIIDWEFWVGRMPVLNVAEAARLMAALDPHLYEDLKARPTKNDASDACMVARRIERLAQAGRKVEMSPAEWLGWAEDSGIQPCIGFRLAVGRRAAEPTLDSPATSTASAPETKEQRQDRRLKACVDAGLPMDTKAALSRLPDGVGTVADREGVTRQAFSADVKAALKRRDQAKREGFTSYRA